MAKHVPASTVLLLAGSVVILSAYSASSDENRGASDSTSSAKNTDDKTTSLPAKGADDRLVLTGQWESASIRVQLKQIDESRFLLLNRGFHWIQYSPFFR